MIGILRLGIFGLVGLTILYVLLSIYVRSLHREKLENEWAAQGEIGSRDDYVDAGMARFKASIRPKLLLLIYVIPVVVVGTMLYITNFM